jgi:hypothetical protein
MRRSKPVIKLINKLYDSIMLLWAFEALNSFVFSYDAICGALVDP